MSITLHDIFQLLQLIWSSCLLFPLLWLIINWIIWINHIIPITEWNKNLIYYLFVCFIFMIYVLIYLSQTVMHNSNMFCFPPSSPTLQTNKHILLLLHLLHMYPMFTFNTSISFWVNELDLKLINLLVLPINKY